MDDFLVGDFYFLCFDFYVFFSYYLLGVCCAFRYVGWIENCYDLCSLLFFMWYTYCLLLFFLYNLFDKSYKIM
jgi:hypothetical protein